MLKGKLDIKTIFILILGGALILSLIFRPTKEIDTYEDEINQLKEENKELLINNDNLKIANIELNKEIQELLLSIDSMGVELEKNNNRIKDLEDEKSKVSDYVDGLNADGVARSLTEYLNRR